MIYKMHLSEIKHRIDSEGPFYWVSPDQITGISTSKIKLCNQEKWFRRIDSPNSIESEDEIITDYLYECLLQNEAVLPSNTEISQNIRVDGITFIQGSIYLICQLGSSYAATHLSHWRNLVVEDEASHCLMLLSSAYRTESSFIRDILRDFILDVFQFGPLWEPAEGVFANILGHEQNSFLKEILDNGYLTINNQDARYFSDGSKRF